MSLAAPSVHGFVFIRAARLVTLGALLFTAISAYAVNPIQAENAKTGTTAWQLTNPVGYPAEIEGYASSTSVNRGGQVRLYVNTSEPSYTIAVYRMGWYNGAGGREVVSPFGVSGTAQPTCGTDAQTGLVDCNWTNPYVLTIHNNPADPTDWASGMYVAKLTAETSGKQSYIIFTVRDDARPSDLLFQSSVTTWQAYNRWGGESLYHSTENSPPHLDHATKVSFNRPYRSSPTFTVNQRVDYGVGAGEFFTNQVDCNACQPENGAGWEYNMVRWLEKEGYDVTYATNVDTHSNPDLLTSHKGFLSVGHDEYWSWQMRDNVENGRDAGVSLGFFSANTCFWQIRFEPSLLTGESNRTIVAYKDYTPAQDPFYNDPANKHLATTKWRDAPVNRPEVNMMGVRYGLNGVNYDFEVKDDPSNCLARHNCWIWQGTGFVQGETVQGLMGSETDVLQAGATPPGYPPHVCTQSAPCMAHVSQSHLPGVTTSDTVAFTWPSSGATIFSAGTFRWGWALDDHGAPSMRGSRLNAKIQQMTRNILNRFASSQVRARKSLALNGTGAYVRVPLRSPTPPPNINVTGAITLEAWVKPNSTGSGQQYIIDRFGYSYPNVNGGYGLRIAPNGTARFFTAKNQAEYDMLDGSTVIKDGMWHHLAGVYDGSQMRVYVDGVLDGSKASTFAPYTGSTDLYIGNAGSGSGVPFNGLIDEARVSSFAVYTSNFFTPSAHLSAAQGTIGVWKFDGQSVADSSGNGNDGVLEGGAAYSSDVPKPVTVEGVIWKNAVGVTITGADSNGLLKPGPTPWNAGAVSTQQITSGDGYVEFTTAETNTYRICGLSHGDSSQSYVDVDYGIEPADNGSVYLWSGGNYLGISVPYAPGDKFRVGVEGEYVTFRKNGALVHHIRAVLTYPLLVDTALFHPGATINDVVISARR